MEHCLITEERNRPRTRGNTLALHKRMEEGEIIGSKFVNS